MAEVNTNETALLLSYVKLNPRISSGLAAAALDIPESQAWIHLQRLIFTGHLEVKLETKCLNDHCLGVIDVTSQFETSAGKPIGIECHGCGECYDVDLDDTRICFTSRSIALENKYGPKILINQEKTTTHKQERNEMIKIILMLIGVIGLGFLFTVVIGIAIVAVMMM